MSTVPRRTRGAPAPAEAPAAPTAKAAPARVKRTAPAPQSTSGLPSELAATLKDIAKNHGVGIITKAREVLQPRRIPTDIFMLDYALLGGAPVSRCTQITGKKHAGKSLLAAKIVAGAQRMFPDKMPIWNDIEGTGDEVWMQKLGVDTDRLMIIRPESGEQAMDLMDALLRTSDVSVVVNDSIAALAPMKEINSSAEDQHVGLQSRMVGTAIRKAVAAMLSERRRGHEVTIININQERVAIGKWAPHGQDPISNPGGKALGFANSVEITMKNKENSGKNGHELEALVENEHAFKIEKNKLNAGPRTGEFRLRRIYDEATGLQEGDVDDATTMLVHAKKWGIYHGGGSSWTLSFDDYSRRFSNVDEAVRHLYANPEEKWLLRNVLIRMQAEDLGFPDYFLDYFR